MTRHRLTTVHSVRSRVNRLHPAPFKRIIATQGYCNVSRNLQAVAVLANTSSLDGIYACVCRWDGSFMDVCEVITLLLLLSLVRAAYAYALAQWSQYINRITSIIRLNLNSCDAEQSSTEVGTRLEVIVLWVGGQD
jgi:hypothetical protein